MKEKILKLLVKLSPGLGEEELDFFNQGGSLISKGVIDSITLIEFVSLLELEFQVELEPNDMIIENFQNLESIVALISKKKEV